jgi:hypothetical protein
MLYILCAWVSLFFLGRRHIAFIRLSKEFLPFNRLKEPTAVKCFGPAGAIQIKSGVFVQKTPRDLHVVFFPFNFLEISGFCSVPFSFSYASSVSPTSTK